MILSIYGGATTLCLQLTYTKKNDPLLNNQMEKMFYFTTDYLSYTIFESKSENYYSKIYHNKSELNR